MVLRRGGMKTAVARGPESTTMKRRSGGPRRPLGGPHQKMVGKAPKKQQESPIYWYKRCAANET